MLVFDKKKIYDLSNIENKIVIWEVYIFSSY